MKTEELKKRLEQMEQFKDKLLQDAQETQYVIDGIKKQLK
jgi:hypothetical protein